jgi:PAS domain S-box-containing protein
METTEGAGPLRILVVDDEEVDRLAVKRALLQSGMAAALDEATSADEAMTCLAEASYDCVLLDYYLPGVDTVSLLGRVQAAATDVPVVIFTGRGGEEIAVEFMKAGAADYIPKASLTPERLSASLRYALEMAHTAAARHRAEEELREQEARFRTLANAIPQLAWMTDAEGLNWWYNQRWYEYTGTAAEDMVGRGWQKVHHPDHLQRVEEGFRRNFETGEPWEDTFPLRGADGSYRWFLSRALPMRRSDGRVIGWLGTNTDITDQIDASRVLREREAEFRTLANAIPQLAWISDNEGRRYWYNDRWYEYTGLRPDQALGLGWQLAVHPDHLSRVFDSQTAAFRTGREWEETYPLRRADGEWRWFLSRAVPVRDTDGPILRWFGTNTDITEREVLLRREHAARTEAERATALRDEVLAVVAHDLRNPLNVIAGAASLLGLTADDDAQQRQLKVIQRAAQSMERLVADLLDIARIESGTFTTRQERVETGALLQQAIDDCELQARSKEITLRVDVPPDVAPVLGDGERLLQVLSNLLSNALRFSDPGTTVSIRAANVSGRVQISVKDSGPGIPPQDLPHVFDRFWQGSRTPKGGAGLGLAICQAIVEAHGGKIWAASKVERGTTFHFEIPAAVDPVTGRTNP